LPRAGECTRAWSSFRSQNERAWAAVVVAGVAGVGSAGEAEEGTSDLVGVAKEVKVLAYTATATKGIIVEGIASLVELVGQGIVRVVEVEAGAGSVMGRSNR
jgi:hypothetical protein